MKTQLLELSPRTQIRRVGAKALRPAERVEVLEARLAACVAVLEVLSHPGRVLPQYQETIQRLIRRSRQALSASSCPLIKEQSRDA